MLSGAGIIQPNVKPYLWRYHPQSSVTCAPAQGISRVFHSNASYREGPDIETVCMCGKYASGGLRGWTHLQLARSVGDITLNQHSFEIEETTSQTLTECTALHAGAFHISPEHRQLSQASFAGLMSDERLKIYVLKAEGLVVAGALVYLACNGVAYLGTAATQKNARGLGYHRALISHRIQQAKKHGSFVIAATALPGSQSRRNLQRTGLVPCHTQALYRLADNGSMHLQERQLLAQSGQAD